MHNVKKHYQVKGNPQNVDTNGVSNTENVNSGIGKMVKIGNQVAQITKEQKKAQSKDWWLGRTSNSGEQGGTRSGLGSPLGMAASAVGGIASTFTDMNDTVSQQSLAIRNGISDAAIQSGIPIAMAIGAATKVIDAIGDATGFHIDDIDKSAGNRAGVAGGARFLNNAMNALPGNSLFMAAFSPGKTNEASQLNSEGRDILAGYSGSEMDMNAAKELSGIRTLFGIGKKKINNFIDNSNHQTTLINQLGHTNALAKNSNYDVDLAQQNLNRYAGTNYQTYTVGKNGMKIMSRKELQQILATRKLQKGGVIGTDTNLLPEGALHARLNHLQDTNPDLEDTTRKGIPVLDEQGNQIAEIENSEIILRLDVTKKIEELMKDGSEEAMIEAGKILASELIENTQDNTGQIAEEVQNGK